MPKTRALTIIAQDPSVRDGGGILRAQVEIPYEALGPGPRGYRVQVIDYDSSQRLLYEAAQLAGSGGDPFAAACDAHLLSTPAFHAQNVYAIIMRVLCRFEFALGRRLAWSFMGHQIQVAPHAFADANSYYSKEDHGLFFGYFPGHDGRPVYCCLSHDVVAHETTHALLDGLRDRYTLPSGPDQAAFHEGFGDTVALLSVFGLKEIVEELLPASEDDPTRIAKCDLTLEMLRKNALLGLAEQFGQETSRFRQDVLRRAVVLPTDRDALRAPSYDECHLRGEILTSAVLNAFLQVWRKRLEGWLPSQDDSVSLERVAEDGIDAAEHLLTMAIRALDYCPVADITFSDFLSALLTADFELLPDDGKYKYRPALRDRFAEWKIEPASGRPQQSTTGGVGEVGTWERPVDEENLQYDVVHPEGLQRDPDEVFRFLWENRKRLGLYEDAYARVLSVRPCVRVGPDGFIIRETVSDYLQILDLEARQLAGLGIRKPCAMPDATPVRLYGGGVMVFDDFNHLKYHVRNRLDNAQRQTERLAYLWRNGIKDESGRYGFSDGIPAGRRFAFMHLRRAGQARQEEWDD